MPNSVWLGFFELLSYGTILQRPVFHFGLLIFFAYKRLDKDITQRSMNIDLLFKKISGLAEQLRLSEHSIVKTKVLEATQTVVRFNLLHNVQLWFYDTILKVSFLVR